MDSIESIGALSFLFEVLSSALVSVCMQLAPYLFGSPRNCCKCLFENDENMCFGSSFGIFLPYKWSLCIYWETRGNYLGNWRRAIGTQLCGRWVMASFFFWIFWLISMTNFTYLLNECLQLFTTYLCISQKNYFDILNPLVSVRLLSLYFMGSKLVRF